MSVVPYCLNWHANEPGMRKTRNYLRMHIVQTSQFTIASKVHAWEVEYPIQRLKNSIPVYNMTIVFAVWNPLVTAL